jgi:hypothetical protein
MSFAVVDTIGAAADATLAATLAAAAATARSTGDAPADVAAESVLFADNLIKVNRMGMRQQRSIIVTTLALYNFKPKAYKTWQRRISVADLDRVVVLSGSNELSEWQPTWGGVSACCGSLYVAGQQ